MGLLDFHTTFNMFFDHLKHASFLPSANGKPMSNDLVHAVSWAVHVCSLYVHTTISIITKH
jgi:hypothetical protein